MFKSLFTENPIINRSTRKALVLTIASLGTLVPAQSLLAASVELGFIIDGSSSISFSDFALQRDAYVDIFNNDFAGNFLTGDVDTVYASFWQFSSGVTEEVSWVTITNNAEAQAFASAISLVTRAGGGTNTGAAIDTVANSILTNGFDGDSEVIDLSSDGFANNQTAAVDAATNADANGITVNTLFVGTSTSGQSRLADIATAGGGTAFVANSFAEYNEALQDKLEVDLSVGNGGGDGTPSVPEPATLFGLLAMGGLGLTMKRKKYS